MYRAHVNVVFLLLVASVAAHPLSRIYGTKSGSVESQTSVETRQIWTEIVPLEAREDQHPMEVPSVPPEDIIHRQGHGVHPCSGKPLHISAQNCSAIAKDLHPGEYGFIPDGGFKFCMKPRSVKPAQVNGTCYAKPVKDNKKSEYLDESEKLKVDDDLIA